MDHASYRRLAAAALIAGLAACSQADDPHHGVSTDPLAANHFITENAQPPATAEEKNGVMRDADGRPYTYALLGEPLPAFSGSMVSGDPWSSEMMDTWTVVDVWGVWCGDCRVDSPFAARLADALKADDTIDFISIHTPSSAARAEDAFGSYGSIEAYFDEQGFSYPTLMDPDASIRNALQISWTPSYLLVSPDGVVRGFRTDLSVAGSDDPVADFLSDIARVIDTAR